MPAGNVTAGGFCETRAGAGTGSAEPTAPSATSPRAGSSCQAEARKAYAVVPRKNDGMGIERIVWSPGFASRTFGSELTTMDAVATSPWYPP